MNNRRWVHRLAKGGSFYNVGPYGYFLHKVYKKEGLTEAEVEPLRRVLISKERWTGSSIEKRIVELLSKYPIFGQQGCFSSFTAHRPGPWDDPLLKHNLRIRNLDRAKLKAMKPVWSGFGFDSHVQLHNWFNDKEELELLHEYGFKLHSLKLAARDVVQGLKQVWVIEHL